MKNYNGWSDQEILDFTLQYANSIDKENAESVELLKAYFNEFFELESSIDLFLEEFEPESSIDSFLEEFE